ncbi:MAG: tetratricopeptide repeat protein [Planctomycetota bacterium]
MHDAPDDRRGEYTEAIDRQPGNWQAHYQLGLCLLEIEKPTDARRQFEVAHTLRPRDEEIIEGLAQAMLAQGDETGLYMFLKEQAENSQTAGAYVRLARYSMLLNDPDSAQSAVETAIVIDDPPTVEPYLEAAAIAQRIGDLDLALRRLRQAYGIDPRDRRVQERLRELGEVPGPTIILPPGR